LAQAGNKERAREKLKRTQREMERAEGENTREARPYFDGKRVKREEVE
jgi:hypothetical protein